MFNYDKHPLNTWVYGLSCLLILILPIFGFIGSAFYAPIDQTLMYTDAIFERYLDAMLFPHGFSMRWIFSIPYLGVILAIASYVLHLHVYCTIIERLSILFRSSKNLPYQ